MPMAKTLPRSSPEAQGVTSASIIAFLEAVEREAAGSQTQELHSMMLLRHSYVVAEGWWSPYAPQLPHELFSLSKSFTSTAIGMLIAEGHLSLDDTVCSFFPEAVPQKIPPYLAALRVRHLLTMSAGHDRDPWDIFDTCDWVSGFLNLPQPFAPGTHFQYDTAATYMLSAILQKVTGETLLDYLQPRLFVPLGIKDAFWETCPKGINTGGFGLSLTTEDVAKFGQFYLQRGIWNGERLLSDSWVEQATGKQITNGNKADSDWEQGYGYQFWRCRHGAYRGDGAHGQFCIVLPKLDAVVALTGAVRNMQAVLNLVWEYLLPGMLKTPLPEDASSRKVLLDKLDHLAITGPEGKMSSPTAFSITGKRYTMASNPQNLQEIVFDFAGDTGRIIFRDTKEEHVITWSPKNWLEGEISRNGRMTRRVAQGRWQDENTLIVTSRYIETPFSDTITCRFHSDGLWLEWRSNLPGPGKHPLWEGEWSVSGFTEA